MNAVPEVRPGEPRLARYPLVLVLYATCIVAYLLLRYRGHYVEQDTAEMTSLIQAVAGYGSAIPGPDVSPVYPFGFGFQAVNLYLLRLSGVDIQTLQQWVWPFLLPGIALLAFVAFREMTGDDRGAALGGLFLFMQPDFLFTALRGSHEKMTYCLVLTALALLFRSFRCRADRRLLAGNAILFYLAIFGLICTNSTFGSSLIAALALSFFGGVLLTRRSGGAIDADCRPNVRLGYASLASLLLLLVELFYFYRPSRGIFQQLQAAIDRLTSAGFGLASGSNPYAYVSLGWRSAGVFAILTVFTLLVVVVSGIAWFGQVAAFLHGGWRTAPDHERLRWLLYGSLAVQVGVGIAIDFAGVLGANLQLRLLPVYMFVAIPTASTAVVGLLDRLARRPMRRNIARAGLALGAAGFTALGAFKATNEPLLSDKWTFYSTTEAQAMDWLAASMPTGAVWTDIDERLREVAIFRSPPDPFVALRYPTQAQPEDTPIVMLSRLTRERMARLGVPLPDVGRMTEVYDNGEVQIYRRVPRTPLQR